MPTFAPAASPQRTPRSTRARQVAGLVAATVLASATIGVAAAQDAHTSDASKKPDRFSAAASTSALESLRHSSDAPPASPGTGLANREARPPDDASQAREGTGSLRSSGEMDGAEFAAKAALIERYFRATNLRASSINMIWGMSETRPPSGLTAEERAIYDEVVGEVAGETFDRLAGQFTEIYAEAFTLNELETLVEFYEGPVGQSLMAKTAGLARRSAEVVPDLTAFFRDTLRTRLCSRIDCQPPVPVVAQ